MTEKTDSELVALARTGDKDAFGLLVRRYQLPMQRFAMRLAADTESPQDIVQEAMLQAYLSLPGLRNPARFKSWLYGIMLNVCRGRLRHRKIAFFSLEAIIEGLSFFPAPFSAPVLTPEKLAEEKEQYEAVLNAVNSLPPAYRDILLLYYYAQLSLPEIVKMLNLPAGAVKVRLHRARLRLKTLLLQQHPEMVPAQRRKVMLKVTIADVIKVEPKEGKEPPLYNYVIILYDEVGRRLLPIWVAQPDGEAIAIGLSDLEFPRPLTHRFYSSLLQSINARVEEVRVAALKINTFYGLVKMRCGKKTVEVDARPSDAIALAVLNDAPIFVAEDVLEFAGIPVPPNVKGSPKRRGLEKIISDIREKQQKYQAALSQPWKPPQLTEEEKARRDKEIAAMFSE